MRTKTVTVNGKKVTVKESRVSEIKNDILPKVFSTLEGLDIKGSLQDKQVTDLIPLFAEKVSEFFPEVSAEDIEDAYPSEIEELVKAFIEVNFSGLKKILIPALSLLRTGIPKLQ
jgi:hypothetical protein